MGAYDQITPPQEGFTFADSPYQSQLRMWVRQTLLTDFPKEIEYRSDEDDKNHGVFFKYVQKTHADLKAIWANSSSFSTCSSFVAILVTKIRLGAGLADRRTGKPNPGQPVFQAFDLSQNKKGWHWKSDATQTPDIGDIFALGVPGNVKHVGVILNSTGSLWQTLEAGQGRINQYDSIKRQPWHAPPLNEMMGWINIDEYFDNWTLIEKPKKF